MRTRLANAVVPFRDSEGFRRLDVCTRRSATARLWGAVVLSAAMSACVHDFEGEGRVDLQVDGEGCPGRGGFGFDADYIATERFEGVLFIQIFEYRLLREETNGLAIRLDLNAMADTGALQRDTGSDFLRLTSPVTLALEAGPAVAGATLDLFEACPLDPTLLATPGALTLTELTLQKDADDTGEDERLRGTLTATVTRASVGGPVGQLTASFDFSPPEQPLKTFQ